MDRKQHTGDSVSLRAERVARTRHIDAAELLRLTRAHPRIAGRERPDRGAVNTVMREIAHHMAIERRTDADPGRSPELLASAAGEALREIALLATDDRYQAIARRKGCRTWEASDAVQEAVVSVMKAQQNTSIEDLTAYFTRSVQNRALDQLRARTRRERPLTGRTAEDAQPLIDNVADPTGQVPMEIIDMRMIGTVGLLATKVEGGPDSFQCQRCGALCRVSDLVHQAVALSLSGDEGRTLAQSLRTSFKSLGVDRPHTRNKFLACALSLLDGRAGGQIRGEEVLDALDSAISSCTAGRREGRLMAERLNAWRDELEERGWAGE